MDIMDPIEKSTSIIGNLELPKNTTNQCPLFRLPNEIRYQIFGEALDVCSPISLNFIVRAPIRAYIRAPDEQNSGSWLYTDSQPCTVTVPIPDRKPPLAMLLVSRRFAQETISILAGAVQRHVNFVRSAIRESWPCIDPAAVTPKFLSYVSSGRWVLAGYLDLPDYLPTDMSQTSETVKYGPISAIPLNVREAATSVYVTRNALFGEINMGGGTVIRDFLAQLPNLKTVATAVPKNCSSEQSAMNLIGLGSTISLQVLQRKLDAMEFVYATGNPAARKWESKDGKIEEYQRLTLRALAVPSTLRVTRLSNEYLNKRGRYVGLLDTASTVDQGFVEENIVWRVERESGDGS